MLLQQKLERLEYLDFLKGIAIFLVVMGHFLAWTFSPDSNPNFYQRFVYHVIYSFHMPLFFFIAGYLVNLKRTDWNGRKLASLVKKRFVSLVLPGFAFFVIRYFRVGTWQFEWFLVSLFEMYLLFSLGTLLTIKFNRVRNIAEVALCLFFIFILKYSLHYIPLELAKNLALEATANNYIFFFVGYLFTLINGRVKFGLIEHGRQHVSIYSDSGIVIENDGCVVFNGRCVLGAGTKMSVHGTLSFGDNFVSTAEMKLACAESISFGSNVLVGWDCLFTDSNFHLLSTSDNNLVGTKTSPIKIGAAVWFGLKNICLPGTCIPSKCVVAANSLVKSSYNIPPYSFLAGVPAEVKKNGVWRNPQND